MSEHNFEALFQHYPEIIAQMPPEFTSHLFILKLAQQNQQLYVEALYAYRHRNPFQIVHGILAKQLHQFSQLVTYLEEKPDSVDIFGQTNSAARWQKTQF